MRKFILALIILIIMVVAILFASGKKPNNNEVVFWTLQMSDFAPYINEVIDDFEKENPGIKIKWVDVPFSEGEKRTLASVLSDNPPDLVNLNPDFSATLAHKGALYEIPLDKMEQFNEEIINSLKSSDGKLYSVPWYVTSAITMYNKDLISSVPETYGQMADLAPVIRKKGAYITLPNITENDTMLKILNKYGCTFANIIDCDFVFKMYSDLYKNDLIPKETITITLQEAIEKYMSGNIALIEGGANFLNMIKENSPSIYEKTDVATQLTGDLRQYNFSLMNFVIPLRAKHKKAALKFALFITNNKNQLEFAKLTNILAVNKETLADEFYTKYEENDLLSKARVISASQLNHLEPSFRTQKNQKEINNIVNNAVQNILLTNGNIGNMLNKITKDLNTLNKE